MTVQLQIASAMVVSSLVFISAAKVEAVEVLLSDVWRLTPKDGIVIQVPAPDTLVINKRSDGKDYYIASQRLVIRAAQIELRDSVTIRSWDFDIHTPDPHPVYKDAAAKGHDVPQPGLCTDVTNAGGAGANGANGATGAPGFPGPRVAIFVGSVSGQGTLRVIASGGKGGDGQKGQTGGKGGTAGKGGGPRTQTLGADCVCRDGRSGNAGPPGEGGRGGLGGKGGPGGKGGVIEISPAVQRVTFNAPKDAEALIPAGRISLSAPGGPGGNPGGGGIGGDGGEGNVGGEGDGGCTGGSGSSKAKKQEDQNENLGNGDPGESGSISVRQAGMRSSAILTSGEALNIAAAANRCSAGVNFHRIVESGLDYVLRFQIRTPGCRKSAGSFDFEVDLEDRNTREIKVLRRAARWDQSEGSGPVFEFTDSAGGGIRRSLWSIAEVRTQRPECSCALAE